MATIKHILFPFDFSEQGSQAAPFVSAVAKRHGADVTLLSVLPPVWDYPSMGMPVVIGADQTSEGQLKSRLDGALTKELEGLAVQRVTATGDPATRIADFANDPVNGGASNQGLDLIMMATHGTGLFRSMLIGSVTAKVLHDAHCPVWTATHAEEQHSPPEPKTVLCAVDGTPKTPALIMGCRILSNNGRQPEVASCGSSTQRLACPTERTRNSGAGPGRGPLQNRRDASICGSRRAGAHRRGPDCRHRDGGGASGRGRSDPDRARHPSVLAWPHAYAYLRDHSKVAMPGFECIVSAE